MGVVGRENKKEEECRLKRGVKRKKEKGGRHPEQGSCQQLDTEYIIQNERKVRITKAKCRRRATGEIKLQELARYKSLSYIRAFIANSKSSCHYLELVTDLKGNLLQ